MKSVRLIGAAAIVSLLATVWLVAYAAATPGTQWLASLVAGALGAITVRLIGHYAAMICVDSVFEAAAIEKLKQERDGLQ